MSITKIALRSALSGKMRSPDTSYDETFRADRIRPGQILLHEEVRKTGALATYWISEDAFVELWKHAIAFTYAALIAENDLVRDEAGAVVETRPDAKGWKVYLEDWKALGIIS